MRIYICNLSEESSEWAEKKKIIEIEIEHHDFSLILIIYGHLESYENKLRTDILYGDL